VSQSQRTAIITAHGQPSAPAPAEADLADVARAVSAFLPDWDVRSATLASPGQLEATVTPGAIIYPFFMSRGWFTSKVLPERLADIPCHVASPFGLDPALPQLAAQAVLQSAKELAWPATEDLHLLLAAHGSARGPKAAEAAEAFAAQLRPHLPGWTVSIGYVEQAPRLAEAARQLPPRSLCLPFFAQAGDHVRQDIPEALEDAGFSGQVLPVTGALTGVPQLIAKAIERTALENQGA
jgi:sirohydrochlorin ferrochelatase